MENKDQSLAKYLHAKVKKFFEGYGYYDGFVFKVEQDTDDDDKIFFIKYYDGDREWVTLKELKKIVVEDKEGIVYHVVEDKKRRGPASQEKSAKKGKAGGKAGGSGKKAEAPPPTPPSVTPLAIGVNILADVAVAESGREEEEAAAMKMNDIVSSSPAPLPTSPAPADSGAALERTLAGVKDTAEKVAQSDGDIVRLMEVGDQKDGPARYSQVVVHSGMVFMAAQIAEDVSSSPEGETYEGQIKQVFRQIDEKLHAAGTNKRRVLSVTGYLQNLEQGLGIFNSCWDEWMDSKHLPARTLVQAAAADKRVLVEVGLVAACANTQ